MKKNSFLIAALVLSAAIAQAQQPSGQSAGSSGQTTSRPGTATRQQPRGNQPNGAANQPNNSVNPQQPGNNQNQQTDPNGRVLLNTQNNQNQIKFGATNQTSFGTTNNPAFGNQAQQFINGTNVVAPNGAIINDASGAAARNGINNANPNLQQNAAANGQNLADQAFNQRLGAALLQSGATQVFFPMTRSTITVQNQKGTVTLHGSVSSQAEKNDIEKKVRAMQGVIQVSNQLQVSPNAQSESSRAAATNRVVR